MKSSASPDPGDTARHDEAIIHAFDVLAADAPAIGVAVSGGSDSLALLLHASRWASARGRSLHAATVDHGLRPEAADEAAHVQRICASLDIPHQTLTWRPESRSVAQSAARAARYALLADWALSNNLSNIAVGHTEDDRLETFLIRARAGSSWYGLAGPMPAAPAPTTDHPTLHLIRPLLTATRNALRDDLLAAGLDWIDDPTNTSRRHERVRMRALLAATPMTAKAGIIRTMNRFADLRAATLTAARETLTTHTTFAEDTVHIAPGALAAMPAQARLRLIEAIILCLVPRNAPPRADRLSRLAEKLAAPISQPLRATLAGCWFRSDANGLTVSIAPPRGDAAPRTPPANPAARAHALLMDPNARLLRKPS